MFVTGCIKPPSERDCKSAIGAYAGAQVAARAAVSADENEDSKHVDADVQVMSPSMPPPLPPCQLCQIAMSSCFAHCGNDNDCRKNCPCAVKRSTYGCAQCASVQCPRMARADAAEVKDSNQLNHVDSQYDESSNEYVNGVPPPPNPCVLCQYLINDCKHKCSGPDCDVKCRCPLGGIRPICRTCPSLQCPLGTHGGTSGDRLRRSDETVQDATVDDTTDVAPADLCSSCQALAGRCDRDCRGRPACKSACRTAIGKTFANCKPCLGLGN
jgi:hypothetical protein